MARLDTYAAGGATDAADLRFSSDAEPGLTRRRSGKGFCYRDAEGRPVRDPAVLARIRSLAIPPGWTAVWICADPLGHLQAAGRDERGRKQYRYHPRFRALRDEAKYSRLSAFGRALPGIRERVEADLRRPGLPREKVLATIVKLLEVAHIRIGNREYARTNKSFGLTTLRDRHVAVDGAEMTFSFRGKAGVKARICLRDRRLARIVRACQDLPGQELFQYVAEDGTRQSVGSGDVNAYIRAVAGADFSAKDFRTWAGTVLCLEALCGAEPPASEAAAKRAIAEAVRGAAARLGNTPAVCRSCYVHPVVFEAYRGGALPAPSEAAEEGLSALEAAALRLIDEVAAQAE
ncbi:MAG TPA: DNA topoisomerase IB [Alphaproteobacteria bacterium]|nr:DNA topoisomerase IB [Alphaproteobacteria bacterium]